MLEAVSNEREKNEHNKTSWQQAHCDVNKNFKLRVDACVVSTGMHIVMRTQKWDAGKKSQDKAQCLFLVCFCLVVQLCKYKTPTSPPVLTTFLHSWIPFFLFENMGSFFSQPHCMLCLQEHTLLVN